MVRYVVLAAALGSIAAPARAGQDIVVVGERDAKTREAAVRALTRQISRRSAGQIARFSDPVCAASIGLDARHNATIVARITNVAREAKIGVAKPGCRANLTVIAVDNGQRTLQALYKVRPVLFGRVSVAERTRLLADPGPVHVVTFTELRSRDGARVSAGQATSTGGSFAELPTLRVDSASILNPVTRQDIGGSVVLIDRRVALGKTLRQLADYAAMRALAKTDDAHDGANSILTLFAAAAPPSELTDFDRAYLGALYHGPATRDYYTQVGDIARRINRHGASAGDDPPRE